MHRLPGDSLDDEPSTKEHRPHLPSSVSTYCTLALSHGCTPLWYILQTFNPIYYLFVIFIYPPYTHFMSSLLQLAWLSSNLKPLAGVVHAHTPCTKPWVISRTLEGCKSNGALQACLIPLVEVYSHNLFNVFKRIWVKANRFLFMNPHSHLQYINS